MTQLYKSGETIIGKYGQYPIQQFIGAGAMGEVYKATQPGLTTEIAVKLLSTVSIRASDKQRIENEANLQASLKHPHIVPINFLDWDQNDRPFIGMRFVEKSLRDLFDLGNGDGHPLEDALPWLIAIGEALNYAHKNGIIHRDVKPENILFDPNSGTYYLSDFGLAMLLRSTLTRTSAPTREATVLYGDYFQMIGQPTSQSDQYSLAVMLYEWLVGEPPFMGVNQAILLAQHRDDEPNWNVLKQPQYVVSALQRALSKKPKDRFDTVRQFVEALQIQKPPTIGKNSSVAVAPPALSLKPGTPTVVTIGSSANPGLIKKAGKHLQIQNRYMTGWQFIQPVVIDQTDSAEVLGYLNCADIIVILLDVECINAISDNDDIINVLVDKRANHNSRLIGVLMSPCSWESLPVLQGLQIVLHGQPAKNASNQDESFDTMITRIKRSMSGLTFSQNKPASATVQLAPSITQVVSSSGVGDPCPRCGAANLSTSSFCNSCGSHLSQNQKPQQSYEYNVFLAHSKRDQSYADKCKQYLQQYGLVVTDPYANSGGANFQREVAERIAKSQIFVFLVSPDASLELSSISYNSLGNNLSQVAISPLLKNSIVVYLKPCDLSGYNTPVNHTAISALSRSGRETFWNEFAAFLKYKIHQI